MKNARIQLSAADIGILLSRNSLPASLSIKLRKALVAIGEAPGSTPAPAQDLDALFATMLGDEPSETPPEDII